MKDRIIEIMVVVITVFAIIITWFSLNINNLNFVEIGDYALIAGDNDLIITRETNSDITKNASIAYIDYINKKLTVKAGVVKNVTVNDNIKIYNVVSGSKNSNIDKSCIIGDNLIIIPGLGLVINCLLTRDGFLLFIVLPLLLICIYELFKYIDGINNIKHK